MPLPTPGRLLARLCWLCAMTTAAGAPRKSHRPLPNPPLQFSTRLETTAHQLNATDDYPPYKRYLSVYYDFPARRARFDYEPVPHMPPKSFVRRYDLSFEWSVTEIRSVKECQKSRLREAMPMPRFPDAFAYVGETYVRGIACEHWREDHGDETVEYFQALETGQPLRLTTIALEPDDSRALTPLMTYDFFDYVAGPPPEEAFRMAASSDAPIFGTKGRLEVAQCERVVQDMGFPYIHFLHTYYYA